MKLMVTALFFINIEQQKPYGSVIIGAFGIRIFFEICIIIKL